VKPPQVDPYGYGFRVPALLVSPYARRGFVDSTTLDFTSILRFIEDNWSLRPLTQRDAKAKSIAGGFDFSRPPRQAEFVSARRGVAEQARPKRNLIYLFYLGAVALPVGIMVWAAAASRRRAIAKGERA
jgi:phospholipase C